MMERMDDLVQFLRDRYNDDERVARATDDTMGQLQLNWSARPEDDAFSKVVANGRYLVARELNPADAAHIARHDPARVLREVDAKREIVDDCEGMIVTRCYEESREFAYNVLRSAALPYADHPDYKETWRP